MPGEMVTWADTPNADLVADMESAVRALRRIGSGHPLKPKV